MANVTSETVAQATTATTLASPATVPTITHPPATVPTSSPSSTMASTVSSSPATSQVTPSHKTVPSLPTATVPKVSTLLNNTSLPPSPAIVAEISPPTTARSLPNSPAKAHSSTTPSVPSSTRTSKVAPTKPAESPARVAAQPLPSTKPPFSSAKPNRPPPQSPAHSNATNASQPNKKQKSSTPPTSHSAEIVFDSNACRVEVTGFPPYTRAQDLFRTFVCYGKLKVEKVTRKWAVIAFTTRKEAKCAVQDSQKINVYGQFVSVRYWVPGREPEGRRNGFVKTKQKAGHVTAPSQLALKGEVHAQLDAVLAAVRLTQEEVAALGALYADLERVLQPSWPGCQAMPFGSITTGLGVKSSDADCFVNIPPQFRHPNVSYVNKAKRVLQQYPQTFTEIIAIPRANTPIVKFFHVPTGTHCDLTFKTPLGALNSKLIAFLLHADPRFIPMAVVVKYWAKVHGFSGTGRLTNYALTMLIVFYLQQPPLCALPPVERLQRERGTEVLVDHWNTGFLHDYQRLPRSADTTTICELLGGFFRYYAEFDLDALVVCPFLGRPLDKALFKDLNALPAEFHLYKHNVANNLVQPFKFTSPVCVQDPFEQSHNVASTVTPRMAADIKAFFKFASEAYEREKPNECEGFLRALLTERPKLLRHRGQPEFRVTLHHKLLRTIADPDWKATVREIMLVMFEQMLKIPLHPDDEKDDQDQNKGKANKEQGKERERHSYFGSLKKPIWKRKQFTRLYDAMSLSFVEKESRITEEIINVDKNDTPISFHLALIYYDKTVNVKLVMKFVEGDMDDFRAFAKLFINITHEWFAGVLREREGGQEDDKDAAEANAASSQSEETSTERTEEYVKDESSEAEDLAEDTSNALDAS